MLALDHLKKHRTVMISLPRPGEEPATLECVARRRSVDLVDAAFLPGQLDLKSLDLNGTCRLFFEDEGRTFRLQAKIDEVIDGEKLLLKAIQTTLQYGEREYFRVNADFTTKYRRLTDDEDVRTREFNGQMNLSGSGMLLPLTERVRSGDRFSLTLILCQDPLKVVRCVAQVVRTCPLADGLKGAGLHFAEIEPPDRDALIAFCMAAQRLELRNKVQTKDLT
jgi:c-di-GMP-binding flagellar brake protein YcgR